MTTARTLATTGFRIATSVGVLTCIPTQFQYITSPIVSYPTSSLDPTGLQEVEAMSSKGVGCLQSRARRHRKAERRP